MSDSEDILSYKLYYFLGVGGIGMSALARFFNHHQKLVFGYDRAPSALTRELETEGIFCHYEENVKGLKIIMEKYQLHEVLIVRTPAVPDDHAELVYLKEQQFNIRKRSEVLGAITRSYKTIAIAGTHGKTTTTTLVTHILRTAGVNCYAFMGGISRNYNTNLLLGKPGNEAYVVVEADEYDRSFLTLRPHIALITSVDADHLDIYGDIGHVHESFRLFAAQAGSEGTLIVKKNVDNDLRFTESPILYSLNLETDYCARSITIDKGLFVFDIKSPVESIHGVTLGVSGLHNVENAVGAVAVAQQLGVGAQAIKEALRSFEGVKRRFEYRVRSGQVVYLDDYAHHPEEIRAVANSLRQLYPGKRLTGIFQPHLFSRTRDFAEAFAETLGLFDECLLLEIYPAREKPIEGINSRWLLDKIGSKEKKLLSKEQVLQEIRKGGREVIVTMGAGDIDALADPIEKILKGGK